MTWRQAILPVAMVSWAALLAVIAIAHRGVRKTDPDGQQKIAAQVEPAKMPPKDDGGAAEGDALNSLCQSFGKSKTLQLVAEEVDGNHVNADKIRSERTAIVSSYRGKRIRYQVAIAQIDKNGRVFASARAEYGPTAHQKLPHMPVKVIAFTRPNWFDFSNRPEWLATAKAGDLAILSGTIDSIEAAFDDRFVTDMAVNLKDAILEPK